MYPNEAAEEDYDLYANELDDSEVIDILKGAGFCGGGVMRITDISSEELLEFKQSDYVPQAGHYYHPHINTIDIRHFKGNSRFFCYEPPVGSGVVGVQAVRFGPKLVLYKAPFLYAVLWLTDDKHGYAALLSWLEENEGSSGEIPRQLLEAIDLDDPELELGSFEKLLGPVQQAHPLVRAASRNIIDIPKEIQRLGQLLERSVELMQNTHSRLESERNIPHARSTASTGSFEILPIPPDHRGQQSAIHPEYSHPHHI